MVVQPGCCRSCGQGLHGDAPCPPRTEPEIDTLVSGPCNCLPGPRDDWSPCAYCGLPQGPGKLFCGFCGHRWVTGRTG